MNRLASSLAGLAFAAACTAGDQPSTTFTTEHASAIRDSVTAALESFRRLSAAARWDSLASLYSDSADFRFAESGAIQYESPTSILGALRAVPAGTRIETSYEALRIDPLAPGIAVSSGLFTTRFVDTTNSGFSFSGAISMVWVHEPSGWRIRHGHSSAPVRRGGP